jgi:hypothetical protein
MTQLIRIFSLLKRQVKLSTYDQEAFGRLHQDIVEIRAFLGSFHADSSVTAQAYSSLLHAIDHLERMLRLIQHTQGDLTLSNPSGEVYPFIQQLRSLMQQCVESNNRNNEAETTLLVSSFSQELANLRRQERKDMFDMAAKGNMSPDEASEYVRMILLLDGLAYHLW